MGANATITSPLAPASVTKSYPQGIQLNWANLKDNLAAIEPPELIGRAADADDIERRANHLREVLDEVTAYVRAVVGDTRYRAAINIHDESGLLTDAAADVVGALRKAADRAAEERSAA